ncbi:hypothetical protein GLP24_13480 [Photobacterium carnosum]|uniref:hypothetical protein n=1 Tax=Photobacterium carnosum TaxID=2023717 RepID=UPI001E60522D|nr:hypothetical protein [Photobacterium carnosum]MCD9545859.1 hypothetical protein [Photobacterium carnosum]
MSRFLIAITSIFYLFGMAVSKQKIMGVQSFVFITEESLANQVKAEDEQEVVDEITELLGEGGDVVVFEHKIERQSCID